MDRRLYRQILLLPIAKALITFLLCNLSGAYHGETYIIVIGLDIYVAILSYLPIVFILWQVFKIAPINYNYLLLTVSYAIVNILIILLASFFASPEAPIAPFYTNDLVRTYLVCDYLSLIVSCGMLFLMKPRRIIEK